MNLTERLRVSVALCTYNGAAFLPEQLASIASQTRPPDDLVIGDDGSTDGTIEQIEAFTTAAPFPVHLQRNERRLGLVGNFEAVIARCRGDVIFLCDQDDCWAPARVERFVARFAAECSLEALFCNAELVSRDLKPLNTDLWTYLGVTGDRRRQLQDRQTTLEAIIWGNPVFGATLAIKRSAVPYVLPIPQPLPGRCLHDGWIAAVLGCRKSIVGFDEQLVSYRQHLSQSAGLGDRAPLPLLGRLRRSASHRRDQFRAHLEELVGLERLIIERGVATEDGVAPLRRRIAFSRMRISLPRSRLQRIPLVAREFLNREYQRQTGRGLQAALRDIIT